MDKIDKLLDFLIYSRVFIDSAITNVKHAISVFDENKDQTDDICSLGDILDNISHQLKFIRKNLDKEISLLEEKYERK
jgi:hypothetical protein